jgi:hypothetical protein
MFHTVISDGKWTGKRGKTENGDSDGKCDGKRDGNSVVFSFSRQRPVFVQISETPTDGITASGHKTGQRRFNIHRL